MCFYRCHASHIMSSCALHLHTCSSHASEHFPRCPFCIPTLLCPPVSLSTSFRVRVLNIFGLDRDLSCGLGLLPVDRLSSFVPFGLRLILQRLTEGSKRPRVCCSPTPFQSGPKPTKTPSIISVVRSRSRGRKPHLIWTLLAPSTYIYVHPVKIHARNPRSSSSAHRTCPLRHRTCPPAT